MLVTDLQEYKVQRHGADWILPARTVLCICTRWT